MTHNNKILTVSYGTFSCTLEGFDDSFGTMKAISEYFRDLAADDRYFGAEPPQLDADMLTRIAQREVSRRVEAREHDGRIMLRAHPGDAGPAAVAPVKDEATKEDAPALETGSVETEASAEKDAPVDRAAHDASPKTPDAPEPDQHETPPPEALVEKVHETEGATPEQEHLHPEASVPKSEEHNSEHTALPVEEETIAAAARMTPIVAVAHADPSEPAIELTAIEAENDAGHDLGWEENFHCSDDSAFALDAPAETKPLETNTALPEEGADTSATDSNDETAGLEDVAAFFADRQLTQHCNTRTTGLYSEPVPCATAPEVESTVDAIEEFETEDVATSHPTIGNQSLVEKLQRIRAVVSGHAENTPTEDLGEESDACDGPVAETSAEETESERATENGSDDLIAEVTQALTVSVDPDETRADGQDGAETSDEEDELDALLRRIEAQEDTAEEADPQDFSAETEDTEEPAENIFVAMDAHEEGFEDETDVHGRVMKVNRADLEAALEAGDLEEVEETAAEVSPLRDEDTLVLTDDIRVPVGSDEGAPVSADRQSLPNIDPVSGEDVSRLMAKADHQMQEPEGRTRRSAFAHLRAAVTARFADGSMKDPDKAQEEAAKAYRSDLAEVVKPRRPIAKTSGDRPTDTRPAPLRLVAEQRVDPHIDAQRGPVAPRRVAAADDHDLAPAEDTGFSAYAEERGAENLNELLEAAAAYLSFVEGHEQFSRPQLMSRVRQANGGEFTREEGLRAFGQLLRTGKIEKIKGGRFTASDAISFKPDHRAAS